ncbi:hypothetical protein [Arthrobacter sp. ES3-54]|uniref:hypothetical protein n=1 Tax=Arthrobacter sp. ES3-54 TaxID=1502991 RepID=UPI00240570DC|nr:hypothetical protein [Arthrobacter sp. ES3-54]MDF9748634.1 hypothetical protein [Arthrobacter sp. ES3-54]
MVVVTPNDVAAGWRPLSDAEALAAAGLIAEAVTLLTVTVPGFDSKDVGVARLVVSRMVRRVMKNPDGYRIRNESIDDYTEGGTVDSALSTGELYASTDELGWLGVRAAGPRAFEIRPRS